MSLALDIAEKARLADLFCGCGGLTLGFTRTGFFEPVFAIDNNEPSIITYRANFDPNGTHSSCSDINDLLKNKKQIKPVDIVIGGPPCQGFSLLNKNRDNDPRRSLWEQFIQYAVIAKAKVIVMENVPQLLDGPEFQEIIKSLKNNNFNYIAAHVLNAANYGVPQRRKRAFILASRINHIIFPMPSHIDPAKIPFDRNLFDNFNPQPWEPASVAFKDLPEPLNSELINNDSILSLHFAREPTKTSLERYQAVPPGGNRFDLQKNRPDITPKCWINKPKGSTDLFGRIWWDKPALTIRTEFFKPEKGRYLHPYKNRPITHREAARLQTFPDDFRFRGSKTEIAKQIGNAVPPRLVEQIAKSVFNSLNGLTTWKDTERFVYIMKKYYREEIRYLSEHNNEKIK